MLRIFPHFAPTDSRSGNGGQDGIGQPKLVAKPVGRRISPPLPSMGKAAGDFSQIPDELRGDNSEFRTSRLESATRVLDTGADRDVKTDHGSRPVQAVQSTPPPPPETRTEVEAKSAPAPLPSIHGRGKSETADGPSKPAFVAKTAQTTQPQRVEQNRRERPALKPVKIEPTLSSGSTAKASGNFTHPAPSSSASLSSSSVPALSPDQPALKAVARRYQKPVVARAGIQEGHSAIRAKRLGVSIAGKTAVTAADFDIRPGELCGFAGLGGPQTLGLFETLMGVRKPSHGDVLLFGQERGSANTLNNRLQRQSMGWLRLNHSALQNMPWPLLGGRANSRDVLGHAAQLAGLSDPAETAQRYESLVGLTGALPTTVGWELPYRIRLSTALALMPNPKILLADFPTRDLGYDTAQWVWSILEQYQDDTGATILVASNSFDELERLCDRVILFAPNGRVVADSTPADLVQRLGREALTRDFLEPAGTLR